MLLQDVSTHISCKQGKKGEKEIKQRKSYNEAKSEGKSTRESRNIDKRLESGNREKGMKNNNRKGEENRRKRECKKKKKKVKKKLRRKREKEMQKEEIRKIQNEKAEAKGIWENERVGGNLKT